MPPLQENNRMMVAVFYIVIIAVTALDLITKQLVINSEFLMNGGTKDIIPGVLRLNYTTNDGAAMGMMSDSRWVFMILSTVAIIILIVLLTLKPAIFGKLKGIAFSMIAGGGIGNMVERLLNGESFGNGVVTDFIDFYPFGFWKWIFNVADAFVCVGVAIIVISLAVDEVNEYRSRKAIKDMGFGDNADELVALSGLDGVEKDDIDELARLDGYENNTEKDGNDLSEALYGARDGDEVETIGNENTCKENTDENITDGEEDKDASHSDGE